MSWGLYTGPSYPSIQFTAVSPTLLGARLTISVGTDVTESTTLRALAADGQMFVVAVTVTR